MAPGVPAGPGSGEGIRYIVVGSSAVAAAGVAEAQRQGSQ